MDATGTKKLAAIYSSDPQFFACPYIRIWSPLSVSDSFDAVNGCAFEDNILKCSTIPAKFADIVLLQRDFPAHTEAVELILSLAEDRGAPVLLESDDDLVNLPKEHPAAPISEKLKAGLEKSAHRLSGFIVSTEHLASTFAQYGKPIHVVPNFVDDRLWQLTPMQRDPDILVIGYMGTPTHKEDLDCAIPALKKLLHKYRGKVELWLWGAMHEAFNHTKGVRLVSGLNSNYPKFVTDFIANRPDIAIAPLRDVPFNYSKSAIKYFEYSVLRIPGVYSNVGPYANAVEDGKTGFLVENNEADWTAALESLIVEPSLRSKIGGNARISVMRNHSLSSKGRALSEVLQGFIQPAA